MVAAPDAPPDALNKGHHVLVEALGLAQRKGLRAVMVRHDPGEPFAGEPRSWGSAISSASCPASLSRRRTFARSTVLVVPSVHNEALPLVILEAMASRTLDWLHGSAGSPKPWLTVRAATSSSLAMPGPLRNSWVATPTIRHVCGSGGRRDCRLCDQGRVLVRSAGCGERPLVHASVDSTIRSTVKTRSAAPHRPELASVGQAAQGRSPMVRPEHKSWTTFSRSVAVARTP